MQKIRLVEILANIRATFVSFFSILMFVALGVAVFLGLQWAADALASSFDTTFARTSFHDIEIQVPFGLEDDDVAQLAQIEGVERVETGYVCTQRLQLGNATVSVKVQSLCAELDQPIVVEGTLPTSAREVALMARWARSNDVAVGDTISFAQDGGGSGTAPCLREPSFTVTALVESPSYASKDSATYSMSATASGSVACVAFVTKDAFEPSSFFGGSPSVYLRCAGTQGLSTFSDAYRDKVNAIADRVNELSGTLIANRMTDMYETLSTMLVSLQAANESIRATVQDSDEQVAATRKREKEGTLSHEEAERLIAEEYAALDRTLALVDLPAALTFSVFGIQPPEGTLDHNNAPDLLDQLAGALDDANYIEVELAGQHVSLSGIPDMIERLKSTFDQRGRQAFVLDRAHNGGVMMANMLISILGKLRYSMASLFVVVGLLVCYSAIARLVNDQLVQIGTKKALGFRRGEISALYLAYAGLAVVIGVVVGAVAAVHVVQRILNPTLANVFTFGPYPRVFSLRETLLAGSLELALILLTTWLSCRAALARDAIDLLAGNVTHAVKARFFESRGAWKRLPLFTKTVINNCLNEKRRAFATIIGVAGCTSLVVCALTLNNNVMGSFTRQYQALYGFNAIATVDAGASDAQAKLASALERKSLPFAPVLRRTILLESEGQSAHEDSAIATLFVPLDMERFSQLYHLVPSDGSAAGSVASSLEGEGAWVSEGFVSAHGLKPGDTIVLGDSNGETHTTKLLGSFEQHLITSDVVMGSRAYARAFGVEPVANAFLIDTGSAEVSAVASKLAGTPGFGTLRDDKASQQRAFNQFSKLSRTVVLVYLGLSVLMAVVVLLNLDMMLIDEKKRELIVLMICGFSARRGKAYVRNDTIALTLLGTLLGVVLGSVVGYATVRTVEPPNVMFLHTVNGPACLIGAGATFVLATIMGFIALRRIPRMDLTDINRF